MKLIDVLVKHLTVWPEGAPILYQGARGHLYGLDVLIPVTIPKEDFATDRAWNCAFKEDWEVARKKWIRNRGTKKCPVFDKERRIDIRLRDGSIHVGCNAKFCWWNHLGSLNDIMAWRFH